MDRTLALSSPLPGTTPPLSLSSPFFLSFPSTLSLSALTQNVSLAAQEVEKLRQTPGRIGTGTAFITFTKRPAAVAFIDKYKDPLKVDASSQAAPSVCEQLKRGCQRA